MVAGGAFPSSKNVLAAASSRPCSVTDFAISCFVPFLARQRDDEHAIAVRQRVTAPASCVSHPGLPSSTVYLASEPLSFLPFTLSMVSSFSQLNLVTSR